MNEQAKARPITRFRVLEAMIASGMFDPGNNIVVTYLQARAEFFSALSRRVDHPTNSRILRRAATYFTRISDGPLDARKVFCRSMIGEAAFLRIQALRTAGASQYPPEQFFFAYQASVAGQLAVSWIRIRTHLEGPPAPGSRISLLEILSR